MVWAWEEGPRRLKRRKESWVGSSSQRLKPFQKDLEIRPWANLRMCPFSLGAGVSSWILRSDVSLTPQTARGLERGE